MICTSLASWPTNLLELVVPLLWVVSPAQTHAIKQTCRGNDMERSQCAVEHKNNYIYRACILWQWLFHGRRSLVSPTCLHPCCWDLWWWKELPLSSTKSCGQKLTHDCTHGFLSSDVQFVEIRHCSKDLHSCPVFSKCYIPFHDIATAYNKLWLCQFLWTNCQSHALHEWHTPVNSPSKVMNEHCSIAAVTSGSTTAKSTHIKYNMSIQNCASIKTGNQNSIIIILKV